MATSANIETTHGGRCKRHKIKTEMGNHNVNLLDLKREEVFMMIMRNNKQITGT